MIYFIYKSQTIINKQHLKQKRMSMATRSPKKGKSPTKEMIAKAALEQSISLDQRVDLMA